MYLQFLNVLILIKIGHILLFRSMTMTNLKNWPFRRFREAITNYECYYNRYVLNATCCPWEGSSNLILQLIAKEFQTEI